jgi:hypothetical protein
VNNFYFKPIPGALAGQVNAVTVFSNNSFQLIFYRCRKKSFAFLCNVV